MTLSNAGIAPRIRILKFTSPECGVCNQLQKSGFYEELKKEWPDVSVVSFDLSQDGTEKLADAYDVKSVPTFIFDVEHFGTMETIEGAGNKATTLKMFRAALKNAQEISNALKETGVPSW